MSATFEAFNNVYVRVCATCEHWRADRVKPNMGNCEWKLNPGDIGRPMSTTELSVCSRWQEKPDTLSSDFERWQQQAIDELAGTCGQGASSATINPDLSLSFDLDRQQAAYDAEKAS